jgi:predicted nucleic acid-binding protein
MIALDTSVALDLFSGEPALETPARRYFQEVRDNGGVISSVLFTELLFKLSKYRGAQAAEEAAAFIEDYPLLSIANVTPEIASLAGSLRTKYYHRSKRALSSLDAIHIATAIVCGAKKFVTSDTDFYGIDEIKVDIYR